MIILRNKNFARRDPMLPKDEWFDKNGKFVEYVWLGDLAETHALRIVHEYLSKFGRVGVSESEWLRRS